MTIDAKHNPLPEPPRKYSEPHCRSPQATQALEVVEPPRCVIINPRHWLVSEYMTINGSLCKVKEYLHYDSMETGSVLRCPVYRGYVTKLIRMVSRDKQGI